mgnify:CR=1 FL=1
METYQTIASAVRVFPTANRPILISCNDQDLNLWVVKAWRGSLPAFGLAKELLAYRLAEIWGFTQPKAALISVNPKHLEKLKIPAAHYHELCFGSQYAVNRRDWDKFMELAPKSFHQKFHNHLNLLKAALFDIWLGNEDRFARNHNLLIELRENDHDILPIDHESILNATDSNNNQIYYDSEMMLTDPGQNLLESLSVIHVLKKCKNLDQIEKELMHDFFNFVNASQDQLTTIIEEIPEGWKIDRDGLYNFLSRELFKEGWLETVSEHFSYLLAQSGIKAKT